MSMLRRIGLQRETVLPFGSADSHHDLMTVEKYLDYLAKQNYLEKVSLVMAKLTPSSKSPTRLRQTASQSSGAGVRARSSSAKRRVWPCLASCASHPSRFRFTDSPASSTPTVVARTLTRTPTSCARTRTSASAGGARAANRAQPSKKRPGSSASSKRSAGTWSVLLVGRLLANCSIVSSSPGRRLYMYCICSCRSC
jgi:hypothetical protein